MLKFDNINIKIANNFHKRLFGFMFKKNIKHGLLFNNCRSIHTFFMFSKIDVIATDNDDNIIKTYKSVRPWRIIIAPKEAKNIYELPDGTIKK